MTSPMLRGSPIKWRQRTDMTIAVIVVDLRYRLTVINMNGTPVPIGQIQGSSGEFLDCACILKTILCYTIKDISVYR